MRLGLLKKPEPEDDYEYIPFRRRTGIFENLPLEIEGVLYHVDRIIPD